MSRQSLWLTTSRVLRWVALCVARVHLHVGTGRRSRGHLRSCSASRLEAWLQHDVAVRAAHEHFRSITRTCINQKLCG